MILFWLLFFLVLGLMTILIVWPLRQHRYASLLIALLLPLSVFILYRYYGNSALLAHYYESRTKQQIIEQQLAKYRDHPAALIAVMKQTLAQHPDSAKGWYLLGKLYFSRHDYSNAVAAFSKAYQLYPQQFNYAFATLQSAYLSSNSELTPQSQQLLTKLMTQYKQSPELLNFIAIDAYLHHHFATAIQNWEEILPLLPANSEIHQALLADIARAQKLLKNELQH